MWCVLTFTFSLISFMESKSLPENNTAILISKYAKVAHWGAKDNDTRPSTDTLGRRSGQALWTHRSDVNVVSGQIVKSETPRVIHHYATYKKQHSKLDDEKIERLPAVGEVIQDRYNPRPYFGYAKIPPKSQDSATYGPPKPTQSSFSAFNAPSTPNSIDLYTSPYSSYNPPPLMPVNPVTDTYPPSGQDSYATPPSDNQGYVYNAPPGSSYVSLGPPLAPQYVPDDVGHDPMPPSDHDHNGHDVDAPPSDHMPMDHDHAPPSDHMPMDHDHAPPSDHMPMDHDHAPPSDHMPMDHDHAPPYYPPKHEDDIYYPPEGFNGDGHDHSPKGFMPPQDMNAALAPPPDHGHFPQYLYDSHHFDHHVYEEVPHTTTEAAEDKRVSSVNYSYYYLGRKLWYVPLYFSIYFIIYVTVLILKAIARHKIQYKHDWISHARNGRELSYDKDEYIENVTRNVTDGVDKAEKMYAYAM